MELTTILGIVLGVVGVAIAIFLQIAMRLARLRDEARLYSMRTELMAEEQGTGTSVKLEAINNRIEKIETSLGLQPIPDERAQSIDNRLRDIEETIEPFINRGREVTSVEYQFLTFEVDRLLRDLKEDIRRQQDELIKRQDRHEIDLDRRLGTFRTIFMISLTLVALIIAGFGVVVFFI